MIVRLVLVLSMLLLPVRSAAQGERTTPREPYRDPFSAALRSAVVPGWVQFENEQEDKGLLFLGLAALGAILAFEIVDVPILDKPDLEKAIGAGFYGSAVVLSASDAYAIAQRLNEENGYELDLSLGDRPPAREIRLALWSRRF